MANAATVVAALRVTGTDAAKRDINNFRGGLTDIDKSSGGLTRTLRTSLIPALLGVGAATAGVTALAKLSIGAAQEQIRAEQTLASVVNNSGASWDNLKGSILATTAALQAQTNFGDEEQLRALTILTSAIGDADLALQALPLALDASAASGKSLKSVVDTLGRALAGQTDVSISLNEQFEKGTSVAERIAVGMAKVGGAAAANADPFIQLSNATGDLQEAIGRGLLPLAVPVVRGFADMANASTEFFDAFHTGTAQFEADTDRFIGFWESIKGAFRTADEARARSTASLLEQLDRQDSALSLTATRFMELANTIPSASEAMARISREFGDVTNKAVELDRFSQQSLLTYIAMRNAQLRIAAALKAWNEEQTFLEETEQRVNALRSEWINKINDEAVAATNLKDAWTQLSRETFIQDEVLGDLIVTSADLTRVWENLGRPVDELTKLFAKHGAEVGDVTRGMAALNSIGVDVIAILNAEADAARALADALSEAAAAQRDLLKASLTGGRPSPTTTNPQGVLDAFNAVINNIEQADLPNEAGLLNTITLGFFQDLINQLSASGSTSAILDAIREIARLFGLQDVPGFQHGVRNFGGGMALVGEAGPELVNLPRGSDVIPLGGMGGGLNVHVNLNAPIYGLLDFDRRVKEAVKKGVQDGGFRGVFKS